MEVSCGMKMLLLSLSRSNSSLNSTIVERIKPPEEKVDKTDFVCQWVLACKQEKIENIEVAMENESDRNDGSNLMLVDINTENEERIENNENIEVFKENENDCSDGSNLVVVNMENKDASIDIDFSVVADTKEKEVIKTMIYGIRTCFLILPKSALLKNPNFDLEVLITSNPSVGLLCVGIRYKILIWVVQMVEWPSYELICTI